MAAGDLILCLITYMFGLNFLWRIFVLAFVCLFVWSIFCLHLGIWTFFFSNTNVSVVFVCYKIPLRVFHRVQSQDLFRTWSWECILEEDDQPRCRAPQNGTIPWRRSALLQGSFSTQVPSCGGGKPCWRAPSLYREGSSFNSGTWRPEKRTSTFSLLMSTNSSKERGNRAQPTNPLFYNSLLLCWWSSVYLPWSNHTR